MFFLMRYQTVVATRREINLACQFRRVSLVHRMETNVARQPFEVIRLLPAVISSLVVSISADSALQGNEVVDGQVKSSPSALRSGRYRRLAECLFSARRLQIIDRVDQRQGLSRFVQVRALCRRT